MGFQHFCWWATKQNRFKQDLAIQFWAKTATAITNPGYNEPELLAMSQFDCGTKQYAKDCGLRERTWECDCMCSCVCPYEGHAGIHASQSINPSSFKDHALFL